jgi:hypothetical protein
MIKSVLSIENQLMIAKRHNSYLYERLFNCLSKFEAKILLTAIKENNIEIAALESELGIYA